MIIENDELLREYRDRHCETCFIEYGVCAHHIITKGSNGGRLDVGWNLMALCQSCHNFWHDNDVDKFVKRFPIASDILKTKGFFRCEISKKWKKETYLQ